MLSYVILDIVNLLRTYSYASPRVKRIPPLICTDGTVKVARETFPYTALKRMRSLSPDTFPHTTPRENRLDYMPIPGMQNT